MNAGINDPDLLKNILSKDKAPPVVVPRSNQNIYQVMPGTSGIDRAIHYINYDQRQADQQQSLSPLLPYGTAIATQQQMPGMMMGPSREEPGSEPLWQVNCHWP